jgi:branched-chain amino acid transport system substrate-binding protein
MNLLRVVAASLALAMTGVVMLPSSAADEPFDIYAIVSLAGPGAFGGHGISQSLAAAEQWVNRNGGIKGRPIHIVFEDDQTNPSVTVQLTNQLIAKQVPGFLGPTFGATCTAAMPLLTAGPVMYCFSNTIHPAGGSYVFAANPSTKDYTATLLRYVKAKGIKKLALITSTDSSGQDGERVALDDLKLPEFKDIQLVANEHFAVSDLTVTAQMSRIKAAGAEVIDAWTTGTPFGTVLRGISEAGWDGIVMTNGGNSSKTEMDQYAQIIPRQLIFSGPPLMASIAPAPRIRAARATFFDVMHQAGIASPDQIQAAAWDPVLILVDAFRHVGTNATPTQLRDYLLKVHDYAGINGIYDFGRGDQIGLDPKAAVVVRYDKPSGEFMAISKPGGTPL